MFLLRPGREVLEDIGSFAGDPAVKRFVEWLEGSQQNAIDILKTSSKEITTYRAQGALLVLDPLVAVLTKYSELIETLQPEIEPLADQQI